MKKLSLLLSLVIFLFTASLQAETDLKQSQTASPLAFLLVSSSDHISGVTGATPTVTLSKNGGSFASPSGAVSEIGNGWYKVAGNATDEGTLGPLLLHATATGADPVDREYSIVAYDPQDAQRIGLGALPTSAPGASGGIVTFGTGAGQLYVNGSGLVRASLDRGDGTNYYVSTSGNDSNDGKFPSSAFLTVAKFCAVSSAGDVCNIGPGTFDEGTNQLVFKSNQKIVGAGRDRTTILSQVTGNISCILPASGDVFEDFFIDANRTDNNAQCPVGKKPSDSQSWTNVVFRRVRMFGNVDVVQVVSATCSARFYDCLLEGGFDTLAFSLTASNNLFEFYNSQFNADASLLPAGYTSAGVTVRCIANAAGGTGTNIVRVFGGSMRAKGAGTDNIAAYSGQANAITELYSVQKIDTDQYDLKNSAGTIIVGESAYDPTKTFGTITRRPVPSDLYSAKGNTQTVDANGALVTSLAASQPNYAPAKAGDKMDLVNAPNATGLAAISSGIWKDATAGDFTVVGSIGKLLNTNVDAQISSRNATTPPTAASIATTVWQDLTTGTDFTTVNSIGKLLATDLDATISSRSTFSGGAVASVTGNVGGNVTGSVGSVLGNVGGNVVGSVASVTGGVTLSATGWNGAALPTSFAASNLPSAYPIDFTTALPGAPTAGTVGEALKFADTRLDAAVSTRSTYAGTDTPGTTSLLKSGTTVGSDFVFSAAALANAPAGGGGGGGGFTGSKQCTLTFQDANSAAVPNVVFSVVGTGTAATDGTGAITVGLNPGTYTITANPQSGTMWASQTITVSTSATQSFTITGTANTTTPAADPGACNIYDTTRGADNAIKAGVSYTFQIIGRKNGTGVQTINSKPVTVTSVGTNTNNLMITLQRDDVVLVCRGTFIQNASQKFTVPEQGSANLVDLIGGNVLGQDSTSP